MSEPKIVEDITPDFEPIKLLRSVEERAKNSTAAFVVLMKEDGALFYDGCGVCSRDLLWALEKMKMRVIDE